MKTETTSWGVLVAIIAVAVLGLTGAVLFWVHNPFFATILYVASGAVLWGNFQAKAIKASNARVTERLSTLKEFTPSQEFMGVDGKTGISVDEKRNKLCLTTVNNGCIANKVVTAAEIISVEVFEDGSSVTKHNRGSQLGGALVGGVVFGGLGAVVGGLSGKTTTDKSVQYISLRIEINDFKNPTHDVVILDLRSANPSLAKAYYEGNSKIARQWAGIIKVLMNRANEVVTPVVAPIAAPVALPVAEDKHYIVIKRLGCLTKLKEQGKVSDAEFTKMRERILSAI